MKKRLGLLIIFFILAGFSIAYGANKFPFWSRSSGKQTTDAVITYSSGFLTSIHIILPRGISGGLIVYDGSSVYGTVIFERTVLSSKWYEPNTWVFPVPFTGGLYVDASPETSYIVEYMLR